MAPAQHINGDEVVPGKQSRVKGSTRILYIYSVYTLCSHELVLTTSIKVCMPGTGILPGAQHRGKFEDFRLVFKS